MSMPFIVILLTIVVLWLSKIGHDFVIINSLRGTKRISYIMRCLISKMLIPLNHIVNRSINLHLLYFLSSIKSDSGLLTQVASACNT